MVKVKGFWSLVGWEVREYLQNPTGKFWRISLVKRHINTIGWACGEVARSRRVISKCFVIFVVPTVLLWQSFILVFGAMWPRNNEAENRPRRKLRIWWTLPELIKGYFHYQSLQRHCWLQMETEPKAKIDCNLRLTLILLVWSHNMILKICITIKFCSDTAH